MKIPKGWRRLRKGEVIREGDKWWDLFDEKWKLTERRVTHTIYDTWTYIRRKRKARK